MFKPDESWIIHLCARQEWTAAQQQGEFRDPSLETEGFIHCSRPDQMLTVANLFYRTTPDPVLLWIDPKRVVPEIRWEVLRTNEPFPHIYGPLNLDAVVAVTGLIAESDGIFRQILPQ